MIFVYPSESLSLVKRILRYKETFFRGQTAENMQQAISVMHRDNEETESKLVTMTAFTKLNYKNKD